MIRRVLIALVSAGWILPMWISGSTVIEALDPDSRIISFPAFQFAADAFTVACVWLAVVVAGWAWVLSRRTRAQQAPPSDATSPRLS